MARLQLESATDVLDLDYVLKYGRGIQVTTGVTGLGLPPKQTQWLEGAGDGAIPRGRRVLVRDIDLPLFITGRDRSDLKALLSRLALVLANPATLRFIEDDGTSWSTQVVHVGGGDYAYGIDTVGLTDFVTTITVRAGDPYFTSDAFSTASVEAKSASRGLLIGGLMQLAVSSDQAIGQITTVNSGDAAAYPLWTVYGPGENFKAVAPTGETLQWSGTLNAGDILTIDTRAGTVVDQTGLNRYAALEPAPRMWTIPPGKTTSVASLDAVVAGQSKIVCSWRARRWLVI